MIQFFVFVTKSDSYFTLPSGLYYKGKVINFGAKEGLDYRTACCCWEKNNIMSKSNWSISYQSNDIPKWWSPYHEFLPGKALGIFIEQLEKTVDLFAYPDKIFCLNGPKISKEHINLARKLNFDGSLWSDFKSVFSKKLFLSKFFNWENKANYIEYLKEPVKQSVGQIVSEYFFSQFSRHDSYQEVQKLIRQFAHKENDFNELIKTNLSARTSFCQCVEHAFMAQLLNTAKEVNFSEFGIKNPFLPAVLLWKEGIIPIIVDKKIILLGNKAGQGMSILYQDTGIFK